jgi:uncharacterized protein
MEGIVQHDERGQLGTFFIMQDGQRIGEMTYRRAGPALAIIDHTEVVPRLRGKGVARKLFDAAVNWARGNHIRLGATCSYAKVQLERNPTLQDVRG